MATALYSSSWRQPTPPLSRQLRRIHSVDSAELQPILACAYLTPWATHPWLPPTLGCRRARNPSAVALGPPAGLVSCKPVLKASLARPSRATSVHQLAGSAWTSLPTALRACMPSDVWPVLIDHVLLPPIFRGPSMMSPLCRLQMPKGRPYKPRHYSRPVAPAASRGCLPFYISPHVTIFRDFNLCGSVAEFLSRVNLAPYEVSPPVRFSCCQQFPDQLRLTWLAARKRSLIGGLPRVLTRYRVEAVPVSSRPSVYPPPYLIHLLVAG